MKAFANSGYADYEKYQTQRKYARRRERLQKQEYIKSKKTPCLFCGSKENIELHHKFAYDKTEEGSKFRSLDRRSYKTIDEEMSKCWCLCEECHSKLHRRLCDPLPQCYDN